MAFERKVLLLMDEISNVPKTSENDFPFSSLSIKSALPQFVFQPPRPNTISQLHCYTNIHQVVPTALQRGSSPLPHEFYKIP